MAGMGCVGGQHVWTQQEPLSSDPSSSLFCGLVGEEEAGMRSHNNRRGPKETLMVVVVVVGPRTFAQNDSELSVPRGIQANKGTSGWQVSLLPP